MRNYQEFSGIEEAFALFDAVMSTLEPVSRVPEMILRGGFPPANILNDKDGNVTYEFAVAGYKESEIGLEFKDDSMILTLTPEDQQAKEGVKYVQRGIRYAKSKLTAFVPVSKFEVSKSEASLKDGILTVFIPLKEESKPTSVKINAK